MLVDVKKSMSKKKKNLQKLITNVMLRYQNFHKIPK